MNIITKTERDITWAAIKEAQENGTVMDLVRSGDQIPIVLKNGERVVLDATYDETGALFFVTHDCLRDGHRMNGRVTNKGGWPACEMRRYLNENIFALLPDDLQAAIVPTHITQVCGEGKVECDDKLFLLSATQVLGENGWWHEDEPDDHPLDIFTGERSRVKEREDYGTTWWWLRRAYNNYYFNIISSNGDGNSNNANDAGGVALGFRI